MSEADELRIRQTWILRVRKLIQERDQFKAENERLRVEISKLLEASRYETKKTA